MWSGQTQASTSEGTIMRHAILFLTSMSLVSPVAAGNEGYYRFPAIHENTIVFTTEGDLWSVSTEGGVAKRLTTHHGIESHPAISPDGSQLAFSAQYEGLTEVYTMPIDGGVPIRRTYGESAVVVGWTPGGKVLYSTEKYSILPNTQLVSLDIETNRKEVIPLSQASDGTFDLSGNTLFFTRLPFQGSHTKRYRGGTAQNIWRFVFGSREAIPLTSDYPGTSKSPLWWKGRIYFASDRDGTMNIWSMKEDGSEVQQHTFHKGLDLNHPDLYKDRIVYQVVADLYIYDISKDTNRKLSITLASDFDQMRERWIKNPMEYLTSVHLSPSGDRIVMTARGQVFVAPAKQGRLVEVTKGEGVRYRDARFMPDGKSILVLSDESGELEFWKIPANGIGEGEPLTKDGGVLRFQGIPSPNGKWFAYTDKNLRLWIYNFEKKKTNCIGVSENSNFGDLTWSPDSKWLAYVVAADNTYVQIKLYNTQKGKTTPLTSDRVESFSPAWSPDGKWLYFLSNRHFRSLVRSPWGSYQPEPFFNKTTKIYMAALTKEERSPFLPDDEVYLAAKERKDKKKGKSKEKGSEEERKDSEQDKVAEVVIELRGIRNRIMEVPVPPGDYSRLSVNDKHLFWVEAETSLDRKRTLKTLKIADKDIEVKTLIDDIGSYELSNDRKRLMVGKNNDIYIIDASDSAPPKLAKHQVNLKSWSFSLSPHEEWRQMFTDAWRLERDYFYDPNLHGVDYNELLQKYLPYVNRVTDRNELNDLIAHLVSELSALHIFVGGGDRRRGEDNINQGSLGAVLAKDEENGGYRIEHIYKSDPDYIDRLSPLAKPELKIRRNDIITAINGTPLLDVADPAILLKNQVDRQVLLTLISHKNKKSYNEVVKPISLYAEYDLRYGEWEYERRLFVERKSQGEIGYVHLRAMGGGNFTEWVKNFYPVFNRKGLVIDVRHNSGGNIDSWILEKLLRRAWFYWKPRVGKPYWNMQYAFRGHMVVLCNEHTASDGEAFAEGFRRLGLGKVIGTRTWGGEIWLSYNNRLVDRGIASAAQTGVYGPEGEWLIEGHGVEPDIVVDNLPHRTFNGKDAQLRSAVKYLKEKIQKEPVEVPKPPPYPDKSSEHE